MVVELDEVRKHLDNFLSVVGCVTAWVFFKPQSVQVRQTLQKLDLVEVTDMILTKVKLFEFGTISKVFKGRQFVDRQTYDCQIRHSSQQ